MTMFDLKKRVAFVTGGNGGIGLGMAKGLAAAGASIVIAGRNKTKAQSALAELHALGAQAEFVDLDVLEEQSCRQAVQHTADRYGRLDILVNNAGTTVRKQPQDLTAQEWRLVMDTNLTSAFLLLAGGLSSHGARRRRQDHQYRIDDVDIRVVVCDAICGEQRRHPATGALDGGRLGKRQHPGQRDPARLDRHGSHPKSARAGSGPK